MLMAQDAYIMFDLVVKIVHQYMSFQKAAAHTRAKEKP